MRVRMCVTLLVLSFYLCGTTAAEAVKPKVIAHRGASKEAPENTLSSFAGAMPLAVYAIEMDVHLTRDGVPIVMHDGVFGRTTDGAFLKKTIELSLDEIKALDAGAWFSESYRGERIPTLSEVLQLTQGAVRMIVEIKRNNSPADQIVQAVLAILKGAHGPIIVGSFDPLILETVMLNAPEYPVVGIVENPDMMEPFKKLSVKNLAIWYPLLSQDLVQELHAEGIEVWAFTIDNPLLAKFLVSLQVDGIITNDPHTMLQALQ